jgi:hypothetical protein
MSQNGSQACALSQYSWAQTVNTYYFPNGTYPGNHIYGQWHAAMGWGPQPWWPVSSSINPPTGEVLWKFRNGNSCGPSSNTFTYGVASSIRVVGDWDGNGTHTQGVVGLSGGLVYWNLRNSRNSGGATTASRTALMATFPWSATGMATAPGLPACIGAARGC